MGVNPFASMLDRSVVISQLATVSTDTVDEDEAQEEKDFQKIAPREVAFVLCAPVVGTGTLAVKVQGRTQGGEWEDVCEFDELDAPGFEAKATSALHDEYRVVHTTTGATQKNFTVVLVGTRPVRAPFVTP